MKTSCKRSFTSFDQILPSQPPTALMANGSEKPPPLTLFNANIVLSDDAMPTEKGVIKNKPTTEYLIQIEPSSSHHSGWMTARKLVDFETLHEILRRIAPIAGALGFTEGHAALPAWKGHTKASLRGELERYLNDAVGFKPLAESEGMKRFLEKDPGVNRSPSATKGGLSGIGWPGQTFENMGKGHGRRADQGSQRGRRRRQSSVRRRGRRVWERGISARRQQEEQRVFELYQSRPFRH